MKNIKEVRFSDALVQMYLFKEDKRRRIEEYWGELDYNEIRGA